jgi:ABC-type amino acid transport system permease subunit
MGSADGADGHQADTKGLKEHNPTAIPGATGAPGGAKVFSLTNRSLAVCLLVVVVGLAASIWFSDWAHERVRDGFTLGGFPLFAVTLMALSLLVMIFDGQARDTTPEIQAFRPFDFLVVFAATAFVSICFAAIPWVGFVPAIAALVFAGALALGYGSARYALAIALATSIGLRLLLLALGMNVTDGPPGSLLTGGWHV